MSKINDIAKHNENLINATPARCLGKAIVTDVTPRRIGWRGGATTIHGSGFSEDVFNQFDPVLGNKVKADFDSFIHFPRSGLPMNSSRFPARTRSTLTSSWRTLRST